MLGGCSSGSGGINTSEAPSAGDYSRCEGWLTYGEAKSAEQVAGCRNLAVAANRDCDDGSQAVSVTIDGETWVMHPGSPARRTTADAMYGVLDEMCG